MEPFTEPVGPKQDLPDSPIGIFSLMFTPDVISHIVRETNRYAAQCLEGTDKEWKTNSEEILAYLGFVVLMGIVREPEVRDYWAQSPYLHYSPIAGKISRKRFEEISRYFHLVDNSTLPRRGEPGYTTQMCASV